jgi:perosamine synthetase
MDFKISFSGRAHRYSKEELDLVLQVMQEANPLTQGKYRDEFEDAFCKFSGCPHSFAVMNATAALELSAQLCQFEPGDEVIIPSHTFTATAYPFVKKGATIKWADIDLETRVVNAQTIRAQISEKTRAIVVVHLYGYTCEMEPILQLAKEQNLLLIEDAAQVIGCEYKGQRAGSFGDFGVFSFHSHKNISTLGEGGMLTVKNSEYARLIPLLRHNGHCGFDYEREHYWLPAMGNVDLPHLNGKPLLPNNYCLGEVESALGTKLLKRVVKLNQDKRSRALEFIDSLSEFDELEIHREDSLRHNYHLLVGRLKNHRRDEFIHKMSSEKRIQCVIQYYPLHRYDLYKKLGLGEAQVPNTDEFYDSMVSFPFHHWLSASDFEYLLKSTREVLKEMRE